MAMVVAIAGKIGSGKTTITKSLASELGWPRASFGDYVRSAASARGLAQSRTNLQELGTLLLRSDPREFCKAVLTSARWQTGESLIIDGLRHAETIPILRELVTPAVLKIVLVAISEDTRLKRLAERGEGDASRITLVEGHSSELQVGSVLGTIADIVVSGERPSNAIVSELTRWIRNQHCNS
jgi:dephospho-CoA kinase